MKTKTEHTPGPWKKDRWDYIRNENGSIVAAAYSGGPSDITNEQAEANARLISAAPDLLAALDAMLKAYAPFHEESVKLRGGEDGLHSAVRAARAAIAKAKGE